KPIHVAQRRAKVVGNRITESFELTVGRLQLLRTLFDALLQLGIERLHAFLRLMTLDSGDKDVGDSLHTVNVVFLESPRMGRIDTEDRAWLAGFAQQDVHAAHNAVVLQKRLMVEASLAAQIVKKNGLAALYGVIDKRTGLRSQNAVADPLRIPAHAGAHLPVAAGLQFQELAKVDAESLCQLRNYFLNQT